MSGSSLSAGKASLWLYGLGSAVLVATAAPTAAMLAILLAPALGVLALDRMPGRGLARVTLVFGAAVVARPLFRLWAGEPAWGPAIDLASDPGVLAMAWGGQMLGGFFAEAVPPCVRMTLDARSRLQINRLRATRTALEAEWGIAPPANQA